MLPVGTYNALNSPRFSFRGSGFVVGDGNLVVTNAHVLPDAETTPAPQLAVLVGSRGETAAGRLATLVTRRPGARPGPAAAGGRRRCRH